MKAIIYASAFATLLYALYTLNELYSHELLTAFVVGLGVGCFYAWIVNKSDRALRGAVSPHTALLVVIGVAGTLVVSALVVPLDYVRMVFVVFAGTGMPMWCEYEWRHAKMREAMINRRINAEAKGG